VGAHFAPGFLVFWCLSVIKLAFRRFDVPNVYDLAYSNVSIFESLNCRAFLAGLDLSKSPSDLSSFLAPVCRLVFFIELGRSSDSHPARLVAMWKLQT
jgi:hypothetical protein